MGYMVAPKFIADAHLGKLAKYLRLLGFDTVYDVSLGDEQILKLSLTENRWILTRDRGIIASAPNHGSFVEDKTVCEQAAEIVSTRNVLNKINPFSRCLECNGSIEKIDRESVPAPLFEIVKSTDANFTQCTNCKKIYWQGSHHRRMMKFIEDVKARASGKSKR